MSFSETILLPMNAPVPDNVRTYKRVTYIPDGTKIKVYLGKTPDVTYESTVIDFRSNNLSFTCYLSNGNQANTDENIIAEVDPVAGTVETNKAPEGTAETPSKAPEGTAETPSKAPEGTAETPSKAPEIDFSKIDAAENQLIQAIRDASSNFKQLITQTRGGRRRRRRTFRKK